MDKLEAQSIHSSTKLTTATKHNTVQCPYCFRKFNPTVAERHIPVCKYARHRAKPPPSKDQIMKSHHDRKDSIQKNITSKRNSTVKPVESIYKASSMVLPKLSQAAQTHRQEESTAKKEFPGVKRLGTERKILKKDDEKYKSTTRTN